MVSNNIVDEAGAIVFKEGCVLLIRSNKKPHVWLFPKGHIEVGETSEACALREVEEETGIVTYIKHKVGDLEFVRDALTYQVQYYLCQYVGEIPAKEKRSYFWCPTNEAYNILSFPDSKSLLTEAITGKAE